MQISKTMKIINGASFSKYGVPLDFSKMIKAEQEMKDQVPKVALINSDVL